MLPTAAWGSILAMQPDDNLYHQLMAYTLAHSSPAFIHQHAVDAHCAQHADETTKPIAITFALAGLYLHLECQFTGREVQRAHMRMAQHPRQWPKLPAPQHRGDVSLADVVAAAPGAERDAAIERWCGSVWEAWSHVHRQIAHLLHDEFGIART
ncbi:MAG TPA: DUF5946 family protein [Acidobacteriaceae bacterium]|nr:DUF5946 family protein [Acidobacteriaceae bacterium]